MEFINCTEPVHSIMVELLSHYLDMWICSLLPREDEPKTGTSDKVIMSALWS